MATVPSDYRQQDSTLSSIVRAPFASLEAGQETFWKMAWPTRSALPFPIPLSSFWSKMRREWRG